MARLGLIRSAKHRKTHAVDASSLKERLARRRRHMRILVCINGSDEAYEGLKFAASLAVNDEVDIILLYVRPIDQDLRTGGLQVRVARENMLEWGLELPGVQILNKGADLLRDLGHIEDDWKISYSHEDAFNDPLGDNKIVYRCAETEQQVVLKLKTAPDAASGILDQYELGPYNLMILGDPTSGHWNPGRRLLWRAGTAQKVAMLAPCSVMIARNWQSENGYLLAFDGSKQSAEAVQQAAVMATVCGEPISIIAVARDEVQRKRLERRVATVIRRLEKIDVNVDKIFIEKGDPATQIVAASKDYSVVVTSDSGKSRLRRFLSGNVSYDIMGRTKSSAIIVHHARLPKGIEEPHDQSARA